MNNLEKMKLLQEYVQFRRRVMKLDPIEEPGLINETVGAGRGSERMSAGGPTSRTGLDEAASSTKSSMCEEFAQDAEVSSDRKRGHELDEGLESYYKIIGL